MLTQLPSERVLILEFKPDHAPVPLGQSISFDILWRKGCDVLVIWEHERDQLTWTWWHPDENERYEGSGTRDDLGAIVGQWWKDGV
jgi:hypothetical protein